MNYNYFIINTENYDKYSEISELFPINPEDDSIIVGADAGEDGMLFALMIGAISAVDKTVAHLSYVWRRRQDITEDVFREMLSVFISELKKRKIKTVYFRMVGIDSKKSRMVNEKMLEDIGCVKVEKHGSSGGFYLADFYDTAFMRTQVIKASQDEHLLSFALCTKEECSKYLKELQKDRAEADLSYISRNPFSYFYMDKGKPLGALSIEHYGRASCMLDGVIVKKSAAEGKIFRSLLAGVLSGALDGEGMQMRLYVRFDNTEYLRIIEENLGEWSFTAEITDYICTI